MLLLPRLVPIYYMTILADVFVRVIVSSIQTNRVRRALYKKILDSLDEESVSGESSGRVVYNFAVNVSRSLKYYSKIFFVHKHIYVTGSDKRDHFGENEAIEGMQ